MMEYTTEQDFLREAQRMLDSRQLNDQVKAFGFLEIVCSRESAKIALNHVDNPKLSKYALDCLAIQKNSLTLFPLVNIYNKTKSLVLKKDILECILNIKDPRSAEFLKEQSLNLESPSRDIIEELLPEIEYNYDFTYHYRDREDIFDRAKEMNIGILVRNKNLSDSKERLKVNVEMGFPQTYVIKKDKQMYIGGEFSEHVVVAAGEEVLAAGEIKFREIEECSWEVTYVNNRSNGYFPAISSFEWVQNYFLEQLDVKFPKLDFDEYFPRNGYNDPEFLSICRFGENYK